MDSGRFTMKRKSGRKKKSLSKFDVIRRELKGKMFKGYASLRTRHVKRVRPRTEKINNGRDKMARFKRARAYVGRARAAYGRRTSGRYSGKLMHGLVPSGIAKDVLAGIGGAVVAQILAQKFMPQFAQFAQPVGGFVGGGIPGAIAPYALNMLNGMGTNGTTSGGVYT
jgi:uncharacterized membrane protein YeaQ/YmgE (transglycosylase-associated protein family)